MFAKARPRPRFQGDEAPEDSRRSKTEKGAVMKRKVPPDETERGESNHEM